MSTTISNSDFRDYIQKNYYYVDKTLLIEELFNKGDEVILLPRPRRFGKTLNLSMLKYYFDIRGDNRNLFKNLDIEKKNIFDQHLNKYSVVSLTFKNVNGMDWEEDYMKLIGEIAREYRDHQYLLKSDKLDERDKKYFNKVLDEDKDIDYSLSILKLSKFLYQHHNQKVVILLDEYDTPVNKIVDEKHYKYLINFLKNLIGATFKGNDYLFKGVITGILRIAKESMFSGANNIAVRTILDNDFSDKFGFTEQEVLKILKYYDLYSNTEDVRDWYNGYTFGNNIIYNPFSIVNYVKSRKLEAYWANSGDNKLIQNLLGNSDLSIKKDLEELIKGNKIKAEIETSIIFGELDNSKYLWSLLLFSGYLKCASLYENVYTLEIPNKEVKDCYRSIMKNFLTKFIKSPLKVIDSIKEGDINLFKEELQKLIINIPSNQDLISENSYHNLLIGLLAYLYDEYEIKSNRESGEGRYDIAIVPKDSNKTGYIMEFKVLKDEEKKIKDTNIIKIKLKNLAEDAIKQVEEKRYLTELIQKGIKNITILGIAFKGKIVAVSHKSTSI